MKFANVYKNAEVYIWDEKKGQVLNGVIKQVWPNDDNIEVEIEVYDCSCGGHTTKYVRNHHEVFQTHESCESWIERDNREKIDSYKAEITDIDSLIIFAWNHCVSNTDYATDWAARKAFLEKVSELRGLSLNTSETEEKNDAVHT